MSSGKPLKEVTIKYTATWPDQQGLNIKALPPFVELKANT